MNANTGLSPWNPFKELDDLQERTRSFLKGFSSRSPLVGAAFEDSDWIPAVDVSESEGEYTLQADLPNVNKDQVKVSVDSGVLTIQGERQQEKEEKKRRYHRIERSYGKYFRSFRVPEEVDTGKIEAKFESGVLTVHLPKRPGKVEDHKAIEVH